MDEGYLQVLYHEMRTHGIDAPAIEHVVGMLEAGDYVGPAEIIGSMTRARVNCWIGEGLGLG